MEKPNFKYHELTEGIIGCALKVHNTLGNGFQEVIYQRALKIEMARTGLKFERKRDMPVYYENINIGTRRVDFLVEDKICVELKAITNLDPVHFVQAINYLEAFNLEVGLLINFGEGSLKFRRFENELKENHPNYKSPKST